MSKKSENTKELILAKALELFNREGCSNTSLRNIAAALSISDGNLRYHYKTKEDIILTLFFRMRRDMEQEGRVNEEVQEVSIENLRLILQGEYRIMLAYKFFFLSAVYLLKNYPLYKVEFEEFQQVRRSQYANTFQELRREGVFSYSYKTEDIGTLVEHILMYSDNWIRYFELGEQHFEEEEDGVLHHAELGLSLTTPYLHNLQLI